MGISSPTTIFEPIIYFIWKRLFQTRELCKKGKKKTVKFHANHAPQSPVLFLHGLTSTVRSIETDIGKPINNSINCR